MNAQRWDQIDQLFHAALNRPAAERAGFLDRNCSPDSTLRTELESLLAAHDVASSSFFEACPFEAHEIQPATAPPIVPGCRIGRYTLGAVLGRGGSGLVYQARQDDPARTVALKVMRTLPYADELTPRLFRREGQALARLDHPGIATIYEAGSEERCCYFAMELVEGVPLTSYAIHQKLSIERRLELFQRICDAVHYAHQRGVIHRDLKPSNILVTAAGQPKVLDFGLARIIDPDIEYTQVTEPGAFQGTLAYASPEQVCGAGSAGSVDVRSDVYSLGVVLYELLSGHRPYEIGGLSLPEAARVITQQPPRLLGELAPGLRGDLATIAAKVIEKEPDRRYASVADLGADIGRFLRNEPISARPASFLYQVRKLAARHRLAFSAAGVVMLVVTGLAIGMTALYFRARAAELLAEQEATRARAKARAAEQTSNFLQAVFKAANPDHGLPSTAEELLNIGAEMIMADQALAEFPAAKADLLEHIASTLKLRGHVRRAAELHEASFAIRRTLYDPEAHEIGCNLGNLGSIDVELGRFAQAEERFRQALRIFEKSGGLNDYFTANERSGVARMVQERNPAEAEAMIRQALEEFRRAPNANSANVGKCLRALAECILLQHRYAEAEAVYNESLGILVNAYGNESPSLGTALTGLGSALSGQLRFDEALTCLLRADQLLRKEFMEAHPFIVKNCYALGVLHERRSQFVAAEDAYCRTLALARRCPGGAHLVMSNALESLGNLYVHELGEPNEGLPLLEECVEIRRALLTSEYPALGHAARSLGLALLTVERPGEAAELFREAIAVYRRGKMRMRDDLVQALEWLSECLDQLGEHAEAQRTQKEAAEVRTRPVPPHSH